MHFAPATALGRRSAWLALASLLLQFLWRVLPGGGAAALLVGIAAGAGALVALARGDTRSVAVYLSVVPLLLTAIFVVGELASPVG